MDRPIIGIDIGWSRKRASCGVAVANADLPLPSARTYGRSVRCARMTLASLLALAAGWRRAAAVANAVVVIDGPMSPLGAPDANRRVDAACASRGFRGRCQPTPIEHPSSADFVGATYAVLDALGMTDAVWIDGPVGATGAVVIETNPTVALAVALEKQGVEALPTRTRARASLKANGVKRLIRAKSDWYWEIGGAAAVGESLGVDVVSEHDHERVAALTCLAIAREFAAGSGVAIGDAAGVYGLLRIDRSWADDVEALGVVAGRPQIGCFPALPGIDEQVPLVSLGAFAAETSDGCAPPDPDCQRGDVVDLLLCDAGGVNERGNPWLAGCEPPVELELAVAAGPSIRVTLSHGAGRARNPDQWVISPTSSRLRENLRHTALAESHDFTLPLSLRNALLIPSHIVDGAE